MPIVLSLAFTVLIYFMLLKGIVIFHTHSVTLSLRKPNNAQQIPIHISSYNCTIDEVGSCE